MRQVLHHAKVVRDEQVGHAQFLLQFLQQIENLRLYRNVQRRGRLIGHNQFWLYRQRPCDRQPLALTARKLMGIARQDVTAQAYTLQQLGDALGALGRCDLGAQRRHAFFQNLVHTHTRVERSKGVLKHDLGCAARLAQGFALQLVKGLAVEQGAATDLGRIAQQLHHGLTHRGLATARLAHQGQGAARCDGERNAIDRFHMPDRALQQTFANREPHAVIAHFQQRSPRGRVLRQHRVGAGNT